MQTQHKQLQDWLTPYLFAFNVTSILIKFKIFTTTCYTSKGNFFCVITFHKCHIFDYSYPQIIDNIILQPIQLLYHLACIMNAFTQNCSKNHLDIFDKAVVTIIVTVNTNFIWINHIIIKPNCHLRI